MIRNKKASKKEKKLSKQQEQVLKENKKKAKKYPDKYYLTPSGRLKEYKENSKAKFMRNSRAKKGTKPANVSIDYTEKLYDVVYPMRECGRRVKNSEPTLVWNEEKAELLTWQILYQSKIKFSRFSFFDVSGNRHILVKYNEVIKSIKNRTIDISKGIYANQKHHIIISNQNTSYRGYGEDKRFKEILKALKNNYCFTFYAKGNPEPITIFSDKKLYSYRTSIDWDKRAQLIEVNPENIDSPRWNEEMQGFWLYLGRLVTPSKVKKYEESFEIVKNLSVIMTAKTVMENTMTNFFDLEPTDYKDFDVPSAKDMPYYLKKDTLPGWENFSYGNCNLMIFGDKEKKIEPQIVLLCRKYPEIMKPYLKDYKSFRNFLQDVYYLSGYLYHPWVLSFVEGLSIHYAKLLKVPFNNFEGYEDYEEYNKSFYSCLKSPLRKKVLNFSLFNRGIPSVPDNYKNLQELYDYLKERTEFCLPDWLARMDVPILDKRMRKESRTPYLNWISTGKMMHHILKEIYEDKHGEIYCLADKALIYFFTPKVKALANDRVRQANLKNQFYKERDNLIVSYVEKFFTNIYLPQKKKEQARVLGSRTHRKTNYIH